MKKQIIPVALILTILTHGLFAGPFGLEMGMTIDEIDTNATEISPGVYKLSKVPKPHSAFESYIVQVGPQSGLGWLKAIGKDIQTSVYGSSLKSEFEDLKSKIEKVYGTGVTRDTLLPGSIWDEPKDFMMALRKKERLLFTAWEKPKNSDNIVQVGLIASATGTDYGYLSLEYSFENEEKVEQEISALEDDAF
jgi:hypothetical protein